MTDREKLRRVLQKLRDAYGRPERWRSESGVDALVATILSQNTSRANSSAGFRRLKERFAVWDEVADAPPGEIEACIRVSGLSRIKAPRIRGMLREIREQRGEISLGFLRGWPAQDAYDYLTQFAGVGPKTAWCVLLFAFGRQVFPVDTHIHRIAIRLGVLPEGATEATAHERLAKLVAPASRYDMHVLLIAHGRRTCRARKPACSRCCILQFCRHGEAVLREYAQAELTPEGGYV